MNSFKNAAESLYGVRHYGATGNELNAEPYTTGTFYIWFGTVPALLESVMGQSGISDVKSIPNILSAFCTGVTPPGGTLNTVEYTGIGGTKWGVPGSVEYGRTITLKFIEMAGVPILDIMSGWVKLIRDQRSGLSLIGSSQYSQSNYAGTLLYWTTDPSGTGIQYYAAYDGVFPLKDPSDLYGSDVETVDKQEVEVEFNVNRVFREKWVYDKCVSQALLMKTTHNNVVNKLQQDMF